MLLVSVTLAVPSPHAPEALVGRAPSSVPQSAALASHASGWALDDRIAEHPGQFTRCADGKRNAEEGECLAAVQQAAQAVGLEVTGIRVVNVGEDGNVPTGCSYCGLDKHAYFNTNQDGRYGGFYKLVCMEHTYRTEHSAAPFRAQKIPKQLYQTTQYRLGCIPNHTEAFAEGLTTTIFSDDEARGFIVDNYDNATLRHFDDLPAPHAYDLFRYLLLKKRGGLYLDIKIMPTAQLQDIFSLNKKVEKPTLITVLSAMKAKNTGSIFNGVIAATPEHPLLDRLVRQALDTTPETVANDYLVFTRQFHQAIAEEMGLDAGSLTEPGHYESEYMSVTLLEERCSHYGHDEECKHVNKPDRCPVLGSNPGLADSSLLLTPDHVGTDGLCCNIRAEDAALQMHTRDPDYPYAHCRTEQLGARASKPRLENPLVGARLYRGAVTGAPRS